LRLRVQPRAEAFAGDVRGIADKKNGLTVSPRSRQGVRITCGNSIQYCQVVAVSHQSYSLDGLLPDD
jgi:hypothetical protein